MQAEEGAGKEALIFFTCSSCEFHLIILSLVHFILYLVSFLRMKNFDYTTTKDFEDTLFGVYLLSLLQRLELPVPRSRASF